jgi:hypothetical protein
LHRSIEILIGRLVTDEAFRRVFVGDPQGTLELSAEWGLELSRGEIRALLATDHALWDRVAGEMDSRLQRAGFPSLFDNTRRHQ